MKDSNDKKMWKSDQNKICTLPDAVLHHILSLLDMKEVVATSLLSTRWRYLWVSVPVLNISEYMWKTKLKDRTFSSEPEFMNFVDKVLFLCEGSNISKFCIECACCDSDRIDAWLTVAARRQFQEIHFELILQEQIKFPNLLFSSSITVLNICMDCSSIDDPIQIPSSVCFSPVLKTLLLSCVKLPEGNSDGELVFSHPVLENLTLEFCELVHLSVLNISTFRLKNLVIQKRSNGDIESCQIKMCTPNLTLIDLQGFWYLNGCLKNLSSLVSAKFEFTSTQAQYMIQVLECVSCPITVDLCSYFEDDEELIGKLTRPFTNVRSLKFLRFKRGSYRNLLKLLSMFPCLETLRLVAFEGDYGEEVEQCPFPITLHHLKYVKIWGVTYQDELGFLKFLLKNAIILEKLVIVMKPSMSDLKTKQEFGDRIHALPRISPRLTVITKLMVFLSSSVSG